MQISIISNIFFGNPTIQTLGVEIGAQVEELKSLYMRASIVLLERAVTKDHL